MKKTTNPRLPLAIKGLYAITPDGLDTANLLVLARQALNGGAQVLQYRNKSHDAALRRTQALALRALTQEFGAIFIVNDDAKLAAEVDADGVHLGAADGELGAARSLLGAHKLIGVSCYNQLRLAQDAALRGANYVAFGAFFPSQTKPSAPVASLDLLRQARAELSLPIVAIGGISTHNGAEVLQAGADALAVISALFNAPDVTQAAQHFSQLFTHTNQET